MLKTVPSDKIPSILLPLISTWITLPFISYWGSSLLSLAIAIWFMLSISRSIEDKPKYARLSRSNNILNF